MGWLIALGVLIAIGFVPLGAFLRYDQDGLKIRLVAGPVRFNVYPFPERKRAKPQKRKKSSPLSSRPLPSQSRRRTRVGGFGIFIPSCNWGCGL